ncbi:DNA primase [Curvivirga aplysinae]|uniref:DNA primase n=1 Tax=Curvivirga aplysinae TaxID=2529852 RepID=UPI0012BD05EF|nr:DNA primase [Curvivirga aplysinae]MTI10289.1 DNA primase [Curvivirga aplysinae]
MALPPNFLDNIRDRISVSDVVGRKVKLTRKGHEFVGLSPFKNEKTPSFTVNDQKGFYHCFATGEHGDIFTFLMKTEGLQFMEAVEQLASQAGIEVPKATPEQQAKEKRKASLYDATETACRYYQRMLRSSEGRAALAYLKERGLSDQTIARFRLGYAPSNGEGLRSAAIGDEVEMEQLLGAGLFRKSTRGGDPYAFFRDRIIFPIADRRNRVIAFGGRFMGDAKAAGVGKYINSPDTPLFDKGRTLYNHAEARQACHDGQTLIVAEGYMDVIALAQAGFEAGVAPLGTAVTPEQIQELWKMHNLPHMSLDGDEAGQKAAGRAADRAMPILQPGKSLSFVFMPEGEDPDSLILSSGPKAFQETIDSAMPLDAFLWNREYALAPTQTPEQKADLERRVFELADQIPDETVKKHYRSAFSQRMWEAFRGQKQKKSASSRFKDNRGTIHGNAPHARTPLGRRLRQEANELSRRQQQIVLATMINHPTLFDLYEETLDRFQFDQDLDKLRAGLQKINSFVEVLDAKTVKAHLIEDGMQALLDLVLTDQVYSLARQARTDAEEQDARLLLDHMLKIRQQDEIVGELGRRNRAGLNEPSTEEETRIFAMRNDLDHGEYLIGEDGED